MNNAAMKVDYLLNPVVITGLEKKKKKATHMVNNSPSMQETRV